MARFWFYFTDILLEYQAMIVGVWQQEQDKRAEEEASEPQPEWMRFLGTVAVR